MTELWIYSTPKFNVLENGFIGFVCPNDHYWALTVSELADAHMIKSERTCPVCG